MSGFLRDQASRVTRWLVIRSGRSMAMGSVRAHGRDDQRDVIDDLRRAAGADPASYPGGKHRAGDEGGGSGDPGPHRRRLWVGESIETWATISTDRPARDPPSCPRPSKHFALRKARDCCLNCYMGITPEILAALVAAAGSAAAADAWERLRSLIRNRLPDKYRAVLGESDVPSVQAGIVGTVPGAGERDLTLEERLAELTDLMGRSSILVEQVSAELDARVATAQKLQEEARQAEELASINREQAEAIRRLMNADLAATLKDNGTTIRRDIRKDAIRIGVGSFIAGGGLTLLITLLVHPLH